MEIKSKEKSNSFRIAKIKTLLPSRNSAPSKRKDLPEVNVKVDLPSEPNAPKDVWSYRDFSKLPIFNIVEISKLGTEIIAFKSGPDCGVDFVEGLFNKKKLDLDRIRTKSMTSSAVARENCGLERKAGCVCVSLYERSPVTGKLSGEPVADSFLVCSRDDSAVLAVADGVNWGRQAKVASRCAVYAAYRYMETRLYSRPLRHDYYHTTEDIFQWMRESIDVAHGLILSSETPGLTTLCLAVVLPLRSGDCCHDNNGYHVDGGQFVVCCLNVGDSLAFLLSKQHGIREITTASHKTIDNRDFRDTGGALGKVYSDGSPELENLTYSLTLCDAGDLVLLTTDGVTDNFDPVVVKEAMPTTDHLFPYMDSCCATDGGGGTNCPLMSTEFRCECRCVLDTVPCSASDINFTGKLELEPHERQQFAIKQIERVWHDTELHCGLSTPNTTAAVRKETDVDPSSHELCQSIMAEVFKVTADKRRFLERQYSSETRKTGLKSSSAGRAKTNRARTSAKETSVNGSAPTNKEEGPVEDEKQQDGEDEGAISVTGRQRRLYAKSHSTAGTQPAGPRLPGPTPRLRHQMTLQVDLSRVPNPVPPPSLELCPPRLFLRSSPAAPSQLEPPAPSVVRNNLMANPHPGKLDHATAISAEIGTYTDLIRPPTHQNGYIYP